ncbi:hypothetical protein SH580_12710 [Coraliomargarita algicola]|uniref:SLA1 homology domain-containing protein n=1 Tax=Coraliomargarita algicola TaxID=3092156 RepID=A0ABZ0RH79_9BACT|nr:hypothetical protein [Coraliomargarita sp. J2-16]WPJ94297.1 hypothetical protein SH580_12710 [Coraliomargarita sp. J2-16]
MILLAFVVFPAGAEFRTFTSDFGDSVDAKLVELKESGSIVTIELRSGRQIDARVTAFSQNDQKFIRKWWAAIQAEKQLLKEDSRITVSAKMNRKSQSNHYDNWYSIDDETKSYFPEVVIENAELDAFKGNTVRVVVVADDRHNEGQKLIVSATTVKADFPDRGKVVLETDPFRLRLYEYDSSSSNYNYEYGYEYSGYIVVIQNSAGKITHTRASKTKYLSNMEVVLSCEAGEMYDESLNRKLNVSPSSYFVR